MVDLGWSGLAWRDGQELVSDAGQVRVLRVVEGGLSLVDRDISDTRWSLRWMLFHHARELLRAYSELRAEHRDWPKVYAPPFTYQLSEEPPAHLRQPLGPVVLTKKANRSKPVLGRDFSPFGELDREPVFRVMTCHQSLSADVEVWRDSRNKGRALFHQVVKCGDFWRCPVCSHRITMGRRAEITDIYNQVAGPGKGVGYLVTFTVPHSRLDRLDDLLRQMLYARDRLGESGWGKRLTREPGKTAKTQDRLGDLYIGRMRTLEITWSTANGWHPHLHEMWVFEREIPAARQGLFERLPEAWGDACEDWWLRRPGATGVDMRRIYSNAEYLAKFGGEGRRWGAEYELAAGHGKTKSVGPWTLLENSMYGDQVSRAAFLEYAFALKAVSPSSVHIGGRLAYAIRQLGLTASDDGDLADRLGSDAELLTTISPKEFKLIARQRAFDTFLRLVESAGSEAALQWLERLASQNQSDRLFA
ncbi:hypothetical protein HNQ51_000106 [Inhella inkyongensis]|uniref:Replication protein n=1 Tax=Inhella inkyongensis TaxID=392593 RepID=A0A840RZ34_9BURK|nr:hypothetical protein [Inhella inkyongensis]MBB5202813.1 hypothetical protein [Inhella inkyongensis]